MTWNFFEASHGKGAPDGIGGYLKRTADDLVSRGIDIPNAKSLFKALDKSSQRVKLYFIEEDDISIYEKRLPQLSPIKGTMLIHQIVSDHPLRIHYRDVSCLCVTPCKCYNVQEHEFPNTSTAPCPQNALLPISVGSIMKLENFV